MENDLGFIRASWQGLQYLGPITGKGKRLPLRSWTEFIELTGPLLLDSNSVRAGNKRHVRKEVWSLDLDRQNALQKGLGNEILKSKGQPCFVCQKMMEKVAISTKIYY